MRILRRQRSRSKRCQMATLLTGTQPFRLQIPNTDLKGPLSLRENISSGQTSKPEWLRDGESFTTVEVLDGTPVKYTVSQLGDADNFSLVVSAITSDVGEISADRTKEALVQMLGLRDDLDLFYRKFTQEDHLLSLTFKNLRGLRLMRATNLFEPLICSILSQNNSVRLWNRSARLIMKHYGRKVSFPDGSQEFLFPTPDALSSLNPRSLRSTTSTGYRAKPIVTVSRMIVRGELDLGSLVRKPYEDAVDLLLQLPGVGPKVADCFLLYGAGYTQAAPVDVWIHRIVSKLYFDGKRVSRLKTARFLRDRFREWAGYAQLYLFDYARTGSVPAG